nr:MAG TPA: hypothetical protein [Caudoviricetes sp.]
MLSNVSFLFIVVCFQPALRRFVFTIRAITPEGKDKRKYLKRPYF